MVKHFCLQAILVTGSFFFLTSLFANPPKLLVDQFTLEVEPVLIREFDRLLDSLAKDYRISPAKWLHRIGKSEAERRYRGAFFEAILKSSTPVAQLLADARSQTEDGKKYSGYRASFVPGYEISTSPWLSYGFDGAVVLERTGRPLVLFAVIEAKAYEQINIDRVRAQLQYSIDKIETNGSFIFVVWRGSGFRMEVPATVTAQTRRIIIGPSDVRPSFLPNSREEIRGVQFQINSDTYSMTGQDLRIVSRFFFDRYCGLTPSDGVFFKRIAMRRSKMFSKLELARLEIQTEMVATLAGALRERQVLHHTGELPNTLEKFSKLIFESGLPELSQAVGMGFYGSNGGHHLFRVFNRPDDLIRAMAKELSTPSLVDKRLKEWLRQAAWPRELIGVWAYDQQSGLNFCDKLLAKWRSRVLPVISF